MVIVSKSGVYVETLIQNIKETFIIKNIFFSVSKNAIYVITRARYFNIN